MAKYIILRYVLKVLCEALPYADSIFSFLIKHLAPSQRDDCGWVAANDIRGDNGLRRSRGGATARHIWSDLWAARKVQSSRRRESLHTNDRDLLTAFRPPRRRQDMHQCGANFFVAPQHDHSACRLRHGTRPNRGLRSRLQQSLQYRSATS